MNAKLTDELREALVRSGGSVEIRDDLTEKVYVIAEDDVFQRAMQALQVQEDHAAIQAGIDALNDGNVRTLEGLDRRISVWLARQGET